MDIEAFARRLSEVLGRHDLDPDDAVPDLSVLVEAFGALARDVVTDASSADLDDTVTVESSNDAATTSATLWMQRRIGVYDESGPRGELTPFFEIQLAAKPGSSLPPTQAFYSEGGENLASGLYADSAAALAAFEGFARANLAEAQVVSWRAEVEDEREEFMDFDD